MSEKSNGEMQAGPELDARIAALMEPMPGPITAREARSREPNFVWVNCHDIYSPDGWWAAEIGTDHGPESADDDPVEWRPARGPSEDISAAWQVVEKMRADGWGFYIHLSPTGWDATFGKQCHGWHRGYADTAPLAIARAAVEANVVPAGRSGGR